MAKTESYWMIENISFLGTACKVLPMLGRTQCSFPWLPLMSRQYQTDSIFSRYQTVSHFPICLCYPLIKLFEPPHSCHVAIYYAALGFKSDNISFIQLFSQKKKILALMES